jgi:catechol 2,3-dioxygenase-like lactoylglutathione lyase family enzyme
MVKIAIKSRKEEAEIAHLRRLAIATKYPRGISGFYMRVFELEKVHEFDSSVCLSDGVFSLAFFRPDGEDRSGMFSQGFSVQTPAELDRILRESGIRATNPSSGFEVPGVYLRLADPDRNIVDVAQSEFQVSGEKTPFPLRHIALYTPDPKRLANFYGDLFGMKEIGRTDRSSIFISDGYLNLALLYRRSEERLGLHHFGFHVRNIEEMQDRFEEEGMKRGKKRPEGIPYAEYRFHDPDRNGIDLSIKGWDC